ncbi:oligoendopeptidase, M3 family [Anaerobranca californiensis DSM 14826]|jgi:M3 family oligoendopeptidase|uniref:Oligoendopeptidase, M3 family n=1 Tax=Anaerobranca californiensis DSM 14826 TaxID=1120989 RepID=A0A1M6LF81_9FIRM|nr:M3 family oligoendopeptidase [Anaerobranca californiensis]SHJ69870.1 oligoendopeptidase, M3 family [Anaerobranca californiensis DSM 14826]
MKFSQFEYLRPDLTGVEKEFKQLLQAFDEATTFEEQDRIMKEINSLRSEVDSMQQLVYIRHTIDTNDEFYKGEMDYFDEIGPIYEGMISQYYNSLVNSRFRAELERKWGSQLFAIAETTLKTFKPEVIEDLQQENKLTTEYTKLLASAKIFFEGEERNLAQLGPFLQSKDREMRKKANEAKYNFFRENEAKFDEIYDKLVKVRTTIAKKLGYENFIPLAYARLNRTDYNPEMVANFRKQVEEYIVPVAAKLKERQRKRIGVEELKYYDDIFSFKTGNPTPKGEPQWIIENGQRMYRELSLETDEFFQFMVEKELMDLLSKKGKASGGYCTYISKYKSPFIFANFNGTAGDIDVLTHEAGHAFQVYQSRGYEVPEYGFPTLEACEIHSMSMEFFTWPWMELFFKEDTDKYKFEHLSGALLFIPYGVTVDEFQHYIYQNPDITPKERKEAWREIEKKYLPHRNYDENDYLERGGFWYQQGHIFKNPFYYIDYTLAQICAFQFWKKANINREEAWQDYLRLCKAGGSKSFLKLVELANLKSPFEDGCVKWVIDDIESWLNGINDLDL